jgi:hypothetical protein
LAENQVRILTPPLPGLRNLVLGDPPVLGRPEQLGLEVTPLFERLR